jgi:hypothetical protein
MRKWRYSSIILDLGTKWKCKVSFIPLLLYPQGRNPWYPLARRLGESKSYGDEKNLALTGNQTLAIQSVACHYTKLATLAFNIREKLY